MKSSKEASARYSAEIRKLSEQRSMKFGPINSGPQHHVLSAPGIHLPEHTGFSLSRKLKVSTQILTLLIESAWVSRERALRQRLLRNIPRPARPRASSPTRFSLSTSW